MIYHQTSVHTQVVLPDGRYAIQISCSVYNSLALLGKHLVLCYEFCGVFILPIR